MGKYLNFDELKEKYMDHLIRHRFYSKSDAELAVEDFKNVYDYDLCECRYIDDVEIDGVMYELREYWIDFARWFGRMYDEDFDKPFRFDVYFKKDDSFETTTNWYRNSEKMYRIEDCEDDDS